MRIRFRVHRLMSAVAIVALFSSALRGLESLRARPLELRLTALDHQIGERYYEGKQLPCLGPAPVPDARLAAYHGRLRRKYDWAAQHPWLPVLPDTAPPRRSAPLSRRPPSGWE
jgi:hypothetical protein